MTLLLVIWTAAWIMLAATTAADAGPIAAAVGAFAGLLAKGGIAGFLIKTALGLALNFVGSLIAKAMAPDQEPRGVNLQVEMGDDKPAGVIVGKYATAGKRKYIGVWGQQGGTPNAYVTDVIEICNMPNYGGPQGITNLWIDDTLAEVLWNEPDAEGRGYPVAQYKDDKGQHHLWVRYLDGTQTAADPFLLEKFGAHPERPWTADMIGRGCQILIVTSRYDSEGLFSNGLPQCVVEPHPLRLYDPRKDTTAGGSGSQRWNEPSTYERSQNSAVIIYNLIRGLYYEGEWVFGGQNLGAHRLPSASWFAAMNECDRVIQHADGTSGPQFQGGYELLSDQEPLEVIEKFRLGCSGRIAENGGVFKMLVGAPGAAVYAFTDDDIVITEGQSFDPFPTLDDTFNAIEATYPEPRERWSMKDAPRTEDADMKASDGGRDLKFDVSFEAVPFPVQVQVLASTMLKDGRRFRVHQFVLPPDARPLEPNDTVEWSSKRNGYINKEFIVEAKDNLPNLCVAVVLRELDPTDYDWSSSWERPVSVGWIGPIRPDTQLMTGWTVEPATIYDSANVPRRASMRVSCAADLDDVRNVWIQVRHVATDQVVFDSDASAYAPPFSWLLDGNFLPDEDYEARGKYVPYSLRPTEWSAWLGVRTPDIRLTDLDVYLPGMLDEIQQNIVDMTEFATTGAREAIERFRQMVLDEENEAADNYTDRQVIRTETELKIQDTRAYVSESIELAVGPDSALIQRINTFEVETEAAIASVNEELTLKVGPNGSVIIRINELETEFEGNLSTLNEFVLSKVGPTGSITGQLVEMTSEFEGGFASLEDLVQTEVSRIDGRLTSTANQISTLSTQIGNVSASVNIRAQATSSGQSGVSRYAVQVNAGSGLGFVSTALFLEANSQGIGTAGFVADRFYIANPTSPGSKFTPFVFQNGVMRVNAAILASLIVGQIQAGQIEAESINTDKLTIGGVETKNLAGGAATSSATSVNGSVGVIQSPNTVSWNQIVETGLSMSHSGMLFIFISTGFYLPGGAQANPGRVRVLVNGAIYTDQVGVPAAYGVSVAAGYHVVRVDIAAQPNTSVGVEATRLTLLGAKR